MKIDDLVKKLDAMIAQGEEFSSILEAAVKELHETEHSFDWTGIYELFPDETLRLGPFVGAPTDHVERVTGLPPESFEETAARYLKHPELVAKNVVRAQYVGGHVNGKPVVGYREEDRVDPESMTANSSTSG